MALVLKSICWNTNGDVSQGSLNCRKDYDTAIVPQCQVSGDLTELVGVFVPQQLGMGVTVVAEVYNDGDTTIDAIITVHETTRPTLLGDMQCPGTRFPPRTLTAVQAQINPAHIKNASELSQLRKKTARWRWDYTVPGGVGALPLATTTQLLYLLPNLPVASYLRAQNVWDTVPAPYNPITPNYIWTSLLDICCAACDDYSAKQGHRPATDDEHIKAFVYALNHCSAFCYDVYTGASRYVMKDAANDCSIKLKKLVRDYNSRYSSMLNCTDCASIVAVEGLACGIITYTAVMENLTTPRAGFGCNPVIAIGGAAWEVPFGRGFSYHEVTVAGSVCDENTAIYDACLHLDSGDFPASPGPVGKTALLPLGYTFAETPLPQVNVPTNAQYTGQFYRERLVADSEDCSINPGAYCIRGINNSLSASQRVEVTEDSLTLQRVKRRYGLTDNPLPAGKLHDGWAMPQQSPRLGQLGSWTLLDDYERNKEYELVRGDERFAVQLWFAADEQEAWALLLTRLAVIAHPNVERGAVGDIGFKIGDSGVLFVAGNVLAEVFCETGAVGETAAAIAACFENKQG